jgi:hypothetical protein
VTPWTGLLDLLIEIVKRRGASRIIDGAAFCIRIRRRRVSVYRRQMTRTWSDLVSAKK